jgi:hypothetical protein
MIIAGLTGGTVAGGYGRVSQFLCRPEERLRLLPQRKSPHGKS